MGLEDEDGVLAEWEIGKRVRCCDSSCSNFGCSLSFPFSLFPLTFL